MTVGCPFLSRTGGRVRSVRRRALPDRCGLAAADLACPTCRLKCLNSSLKARIDMQASRAGHARGRLGNIPGPPFTGCSICVSICFKIAAAQGAHGSGLHDDSTCTCTCTHPAGASDTVTFFLA